MVSLFCEGDLDAVALRQIIETKTQLSIGVVVSGKGKQYLQSKTTNLNQSARGHPIIVVADQDNPNECASTQVNNWLLGRTRTPNFLLRFASLAIETWLLADRNNICDFLSVARTSVPRNVESIRNPKNTLVNIARSSRNRATREAMVPTNRSRALVGPNYNPELSKFVTQRWDIDAASDESDSLRRAVTRIIELDDRIANGL